MVGEREDMNKKPNIIIRWRWAFTVAAILEILNTADHFVKQNISGLPMPSILFILLLAFGAAGMIFLAVVSWWGYLNLQRRGLSRRKD